MNTEYQVLKCGNCNDKHQVRAGPDQDGRFYIIDCSCPASMLTQKDKEISKLKAKIKKLSLIAQEDKG